MSTASPIRTITPATRKRWTSAVSGLGRRGIQHAALTGVAICLYAFHMRGSLYGDEWHTLDAVTNGSFWANIFSPGMSHPPLYFVLAKLGYIVVGEPWGIRLPSTCFAIATVVALPFVARQILGGPAYLLAAWLTAFSPYLLEFAPEGRPYATLIFFSLLFVQQLVSFVDKQTRGTFLLLLACSILGLLTHYLFSFQLAFGFVYYLSQHRRAPGYVWWYAVLVLVMVLPATPIVWRHITHVGQSTRDWSAGQAEFDAVNFVIRLPVALTFGYCTFDLPALDAARNVPLGAAAADSLLLFIVAGMTLAGFAAVWIKLLLEAHRRIALLTLGIVVPLLFGLLAAALHLFILREKYLASIFPCVVLLQVLIVSRARQCSWGRVLVASYAAVVAVSITHFAAYPHEYSRRSDWEGLRTALRNEVREGDCVVLYHMHHSRRSRLELVPAQVPEFDLMNACPRDVPLAEFVRQIDRQFGGTVYLVAEEGMRHGVDRNGEVVRVLGASRNASSVPFGRNLRLRIFEPMSSGLAPGAAGG